MRFDVGWLLGKAQLFILPRLFSFSPPSFYLVFFVKSEIWANQLVCCWVRSRRKVFFSSCVAIPSLFFPPRGSLSISASSSPRE